MPRAQAAQFLQAADEVFLVRHLLAVVLDHVLPGLRRFHPARMPLDERGIEFTLQ